MASVKALPDFCAGDGLVVPRIPSLVRAFLRGVSADALESLESIGAPDNWTGGFQAERTLSVTDEFRHWTSSLEEDPVGKACVFAHDPIALRPPASQKWVIASDGRVLLCSRIGDDAKIYSYNTSYSAFVVFVTALKAHPVEDESSIRDLITVLYPFDPTAFRRGGAWEAVCAEWAYGDPYKEADLEEIRLMVSRCRAR